MQQEQMTLPIGGIVRDPYGGQYIIEALLGKGQSEAVYLIRDRHFTQHLFALKEFIEPDERERVRFTREGERLLRLDHRALPRVYCVFEYAKRKRVYLLMDYIQGQNLQDLRREQPAQRFALPLVLALLNPIVDALRYLHRQDPPIVHGDVKPANIIVPVEDYDAILVGFSIARQYAADATAVAIGHVSPGYAAPEQYGSKTTPRADIYGLGATLYTLLTGAVPPDASAQITASKEIDLIQPAKLIAPDIPGVVAATIERAMSLRSDDRFETIGEFWQEVTAHPLRQLEHTSPVTSVVTPQTPPPEPNLEKMTPAPAPNQLQQAAARRRDTLLVLVLALLIGLAIGASSFALLMRYPRPPAAAHKIIPTPTAIPRSSIYPILADSYAGTVVDLLNNEKTAMYLTNIQQNQGKLRGFFQGLGMAGPFTGTVSLAGHVQFTAKVQAEDTTLVFLGDIKIGGDMVGNFAVLGQQGCKTGETGIWNIAASP